MNKNLELVVLCLSEEVKKEDHIVLGKMSSNSLNTRSIKGTLFPKESDANKFAQKISFTLEMPKAL